MVKAFAIFCGTQTIITVIVYAYLLPGRRGD
jgi:hypothetical protein